MSGYIAWAPVFRIVGHTVLAFVITVLAVGCVAAPDMWYGDLPYHAGLADRVSVVTVAALSVVGAPHWFLSFALPSASQMLSWSDASAVLPAALAPCVAGFMAGLLAYLSSGRPLTLSIAEKESLRAVHLRGPRLLQGRAATFTGSAAESTAIMQGGRGIYLAPGLPISLRRETRQIMIVGSIGGGKSEFIKFLLSQMIERGDRMLIHDPKSELVSEFPTDDFAMLSPVDSRSHAWDVAADCLGEASARELASKLVSAPKSSDGPWTDGAREVLFGLIFDLQQTNACWHWGHLADSLALPCSGMREILKRSYPPALTYLEVDANGAPTKTTISFMVTLSSSVSALIRQLGMAWGHGFEGTRLSLSRWLLDDKAKPQALLLVSAADYSQISKLWTGAAVSLMSRIVASPRMGNSSRRRVWMVLDECKQLGRLDDFQSLMEVGRSRGVRVITAWQDLKQIEQVYTDRADFDVFTALPKTKVVFQCSPGASAKHISEEWIGQRLVRLPDETMRGGKQDSASSHETWIPVVTSQELDSALGVVRSEEGDDVARGLILGIGPDALLAEWPSAGWVATRPARVPAAWTGDCGPETERDEAVQ